MKNKKNLSNKFALFLASTGLISAISLTFLLKNFYENKICSSKFDFSQEKNIIYEKPETHYNPPIDPRGFLGIENYNKSLERLSEQ